MMGIMKKDDIPGLFSALADRPLADRLRPSALEALADAVTYKLYKTEQARWRAEC